MRWTRVGTAFLSSVITLAVVVTLLMTTNWAGLTFLHIFLMLWANCVLFDVILASGAWVRRRRTADSIPKPPGGPRIPAWGDGRSRNVATVAAGVLVVSLVAVVAWLFSEIGSTEASLRATEAQLRQQSVALTATRDDLRVTAEGFNAARVDLSRALADRDAVQLASTQLAQDITVLEAAVAQANANNGDLAGLLASSRSDNAVLTVSLAAAADMETELRTALDDAEAENTALTTDRDLFESRYNTLEEKVGTIESMEIRAQNLRTEITDLEERRRPLILRADSLETEGFTCTASMEPAITCLDTATWVLDVAPNAIVVGSTISFISTACWPEESEYMVAHRVVDVQIIDGQRHYWTKGDGNRWADDCWIPHAAVDSYIVEIHKNTVPENRALRNYVNRAKLSFWAAYDSLEDAWSHYDTVAATYEGLRVQNGCPSDFEAECFVDDSAYNELLQAFHAVDRAIDAIDVERQRYSHTKREYDCWVRSAGSSQYPGHIPKLCIFPSFEEAYGPFN